MHVHSTVFKDAETFQYPSVLLYLNILFYSDKQNYMAFLNSNLQSLSFKCNLHFFYCGFLLFVVLCHYLCHMCVLKVYVYSHVIVHVC